MVGGRPWDVVIADSLRACAFFVRPPTSTRTAYSTYLAVCVILDCCCFYFLATGREHQDAGKQRAGGGRGCDDGADARIEHPRGGATMSNGLETIKGARSSRLRTEYPR